MSNVSLGNRHPPKGKGITNADRLEWVLHGEVGDLVEDIMRYMEGDNDESKKWPKRQMVAVANELCDRLEIPRGKQVRPIIEHHDIHVSAEAGKLLIQRLNKNNPTKEAP